jgi:NitT/TauT family transport system substrate-binding protein
LTSLVPPSRTLADFSAKDRIAVPTVKVSAQAVMLQIAAERQFGGPRPRRRS